ncbi:hypothetical protein GCM10009555_063110 [Acrocarpospora macrocephala]|uniref:VWFA domain-containing protein n=1 Tax=Acrocarpospora macrocephala TaxID=150177 RepID=A0A5M3WFK3_9ACTN|nr:vWA domain-containing protein [Acrocarpospora macrocephala]GES07754.1 hypothetical protein Amac_013490 [Acrocarpospora macrocephala]
MSDQSVRIRLAELIVDALEVGTGKHERDVIHDLFSLFGIDFTALERGNSRHGTARLRAVASADLAAAAPTAEDLLNAVLQCGGRFVAMLEEIYQRLDRHTASTNANEEIRLRRAGVREDLFTVSPAFIEQVRRTIERLATIQIGRLDVEAIGRFLGGDGGEYYGVWPPGTENRFANALLTLRRVEAGLTDLRFTPAERREAAMALDRATRAAEQVIAAAERLIRSHLLGLDLAGVDAPDGDTDSDDRSSRLEQRFSDERRFYQETGMIGAWLGTARFNGVEPGFLGLNRRLETVWLAPPAGPRSRTDLGTLACFVAQWRGGHWSDRSSNLFGIVTSSTERLTAWLADLTEHCGTAASWLADRVLPPQSTVSARETVEILEDFLNLPMWRQRSLIYEIWVLCATLEACERAGWETSLLGLKETGKVWELPAHGADRPVALLSREAPEERIFLEVWREPRRATASGELTPDVTVSTPRPYVRDLVVVEAKDRVRMTARRRRNAPPGGDDHSRALPVAERYAAALRPAVTWVVNHCDYRDPVDPAEEFGTAWSHIRLAACFRPGEIPDAFHATVLAAIAPPVVAPPETDAEDGPEEAARGGLLLVLDMTYSMRRRRDWLFTALTVAPLAERFSVFRAVVYSDHGADEPFLVRTLGPYPALGALLEVVAELPDGDGGDWAEALEDALQRCRELVAEAGPQTVLILTDASPHSSDECPYRIDAATEAAALAAAGCQLLAAGDWLPADAWPWAPEDLLIAPLSVLLADPA